MMIAGIAKKFALIFLFSISVPGAQAMILPDNDLHKEDSLTREDANMDEATFNAIIDKALAFYEPLAKHHGADLKVERLWNDPTVNAFAMRIWKFWQVSMYGGLARRPEITEDGFALVLCHELGHLFAGYPYDRTFMGRLVWHSLEGEADYFATHVCARELWGSEKAQNAVHAATVDNYAKSLCDSVWGEKDSRDLCYRIADASQSLGNLLGHKSGAPHFDTPDNSAVKKTFKRHPKAQCRLDTYISGALCPTEFDKMKIPGKTVSGHFGFLFNRKAEREAALASCHTALGHDEGVRPQCWFSPRKKLGIKSSEDFSEDSVDEEFAVQSDADDITADQE
jgi:hypothetical protein